jgi:hypothetical protein
MGAEDHTGEHSFDELARGLASGSVSRRKALKLMGAALAGGALASIPGVAQAAPPQPCPEGTFTCGKGRRAFCLAEGQGYNCCEFGKVTTACGPPFPICCGFYQGGKLVSTSCATTVEECELRGGRVP